VKLNYHVVTEAIASLRAAPAGSTLDDEWSKEIEEDFQSRVGKKEFKRRHD